MKNRKLIKYGAIQAVAILAAVAFTQPVLAECIQSEPTAAEVVFTVDANSGCDSISGHFGCNVPNFKKEVLGGMEGSCTYRVDINDEFSPGYIATAFIADSNGGLTWTIEQLDPENPVGIDVSVVGGGFKGNNCGYSYEFDVVSGSGGDCKVWDGDVCVTFQNITGLDVCTDLMGEVPPEPPVEPSATLLKPCQTDEEFSNDVNGELDDTGIKCPVYPDDDPEGRGGQQKPVIVCNLEVDEHAFGTIGAHDANSGVEEQVCCKCGITGDTACFISPIKATNVIEQDDGTLIDEDTGCIVEAKYDPTQEVILQFQKDRGSDPCEKIRSGGKVYKTCW